jgi:Concanavalin A-like lectin/glucanases superfamily/Carbohydrate binding domain
MSVTSGPNTVRNGLVGVLDAGDLSLFSANVHPRPTDSFAWFQPGGANVMTLSRATGVVSPVGNTPTQIVTTGTSGYTGTYNNSTWNLAPAAIGQTWTFSFWVKGASSSTFAASAMVFEANSSGAYTTLTQTGFTVTPTWTRVSVTRTMDQATTAFVQVRIDCYVNNQTLWVDGLQVERSAVPTTFNPTPNINGATARDGYGRTMTVAGGVAFDGISWILPPDQTTSYLINSNYPWPTGDFTAEHWIRSTFNQPNQTPYTYSIAGDNQYLMFTNSSTEYAPFSFGNPATSVAVPNMNNTWHCFTRNRVATTGVERFYHNGVFVGTATVSADSGATTNGYLIVGQESDSPGGGFDPNQNLDGRFGRLMIYNRALSDAEILQNYNAVRSRYGL